jgi:hypothetical protein
MKKQNAKNNVDQEQPTFSNIMDLTTSFTKILKHCRQLLGIKFDFGNCRILSVWLHTEFEEYSEWQAAKMVWVACLATTLKVSTPACKIISFN